MLRLLFILLPAMNLIFGCNSSKPISYEEKRVKYIHKLEVSCSELDGQRLQGYKLTFGPYNDSILYQEAACTYEKDKLFSGYPNDEKIRLLEELLSFEGDTSACSKKVCLYGYSKLAKPKSNTYSVQIDALYLFTLLTASSYSPYYCPYPVLKDTLTGEEINADVEKVKEVFTIYKEWFSTQKKKGFVKYNMPLRNSRYEWYGTWKDKAYMYTDSFSISKLDASAVVIGNCK